MCLIPSCIIVEVWNQIILYRETYQIIIDLRIMFENFRILELRELFRETETIIICWNRIVSDKSRYVETMRIAFDWWWDVNLNGVYILPLCPYCSIGSPLIVLGMYPYSTDFLKIHFLNQQYKFSLFFV